MSMQWKGLDKLQVKLQSNKTLQGAKKLIKLNGAELQKWAMLRAPVKTGFLKRSIKLQIIDDGMAAKVTVEAEYAPYVEWGTRYMNARPFLRPSYNEQKIRLYHDLERLTR